MFVCLFVMLFYSNNGKMHLHPGNAIIWCIFKYLHVFWYRHAHNQVLPWAYTWCRNYIYKSILFSILYSHNFCRKVTGNTTCFFGLTKLNLSYFGLCFPLSLMHTLPLIPYPTSNIASRKSYFGLCFPT